MIPTHVLVLTMPTRPSYPTKWWRLNPAKILLVLLPGNLWLNSVISSVEPGHWTCSCHNSTWILWPRRRCVCQYLHDIKLRITLSKSTDNMVCTASFWWRGEGGSSWCFHTRHDEVSSSNMDRNVTWKCYRQNQWTAHLWLSLMSGLSGT